MIQEISSSFHYLNRGTWATHVQLASLASRLESSQLLCAKPPKSPRSRPSSGLWNPNHLRPFHLGDDFLCHPNGLVPTPLLLHLPNLVCNHLAICLLLDDVGVALGLVLAVRLGADEGVLTDKRRIPLRSTSVRTPHLFHHGIPKVLVNPRSKGITSVRSTFTL
jgi:hypothetical protein